jgi:hypothetical protein
VASSIDDSTSRIVRYLNERDIAINVLSFQVFASGEDRLLSRAWLLDPGQTQANAAVSQDQAKSRGSARSTRLSATAGRDPGTRPCATASSRPAAGRGTPTP